MAFKQVELSYAFNALEPHIDARTMEIHYSKHHAAYTAKFNAAVEGTDLEGKSAEEIFANISSAPAAVKNNGGGFFNHNLYWEIMGPDGEGAPTAQMNITKAIDRDFGSFENFKNEFANAAATQFGSGWAWLCVNKNDKLFICSTSNQENPLMDTNDFNGTPILTVDVWEHAYYLHYQNRRPDHIEAFFNVINWHEVTKKYNDANEGASSF